MTAMGESYILVQHAATGSDDGRWPWRAPVALPMGLISCAMNAQAPASRPASLPEMSLPEWLVLAILSQQQAHGFAVAQLTASGGHLGRVWQIPKAVVYRA